MFVLLGWLNPAAAADFFPLHQTNSAVRVVMVQGENLLDAFLPDDERVAAAFNLGLIKFTRTTSVAAAWQSLVKTSDTVGIKVFSEPGPICGTRPRSEEHTSELQSRQYLVC